MKKKNNKVTTTRELNRLNKLWDKKLAESGFKDIEDRRTGMLKVWSGNVSYNHLAQNQPDIFLEENKPKKISTEYGYSSLSWKESQQEYYRLACQALHERDFKTVRHKLIWQLHAEGLSQRQIAQELRTTRREIRNALELMAKEFGLPAPAL